MPRLSGVELLIGLLLEQHAPEPCDYSRVGREFAEYLVSLGDVAAVVPVEPNGPLLLSKLNEQEGRLLIVLVLPEVGVFKVLSDLHEQVNVLLLLARLEVLAQLLQHERHKDIFFLQVIYGLDVQALHILTPRPLPLQLLMVTTRQL